MHRGRGRADLVERLAVNNDRIHIEPNIDPGLAARADRDALLVMSDPTADLVP